MVKQLKPSLEVLLVYGLADNRVDIKEQFHLYKALQRNNIKTKIITIPRAEHHMDGYRDQVKKMISDFLWSY